MASFGSSPARNLCLGPLVSLSNIAISQSGTTKEERLLYLLS